MEECFGWNVDKIIDKTILETCGYASDGLFGHLGKGKGRNFKLIS